MTHSLRLFAVKASRPPRVFLVGALLAAVPALVGSIGCNQAPVAEAPAGNGDAQLIVHNAVIYTVDTARPKAEALVSRGGRIVFVGDNAGALAMKGAKTRVIDAGGRAVIPGLHDAHGHFMGLGSALQQIDLRGTPSYEAIVEKVRERAAKARPGEWILGRSWDQNDWPKKEWPTHEALDKAAPNNPVYLTRVDGHAALANKAALDAAGITAKTADPDGGRLIRDAKGVPTGVLVDTAMGLVRRKMSEPSAEQLDEQVTLADAECRRLGLTTVSPPTPAS